METNSYQLNDREHATILAALRRYQMESVQPEGIREIATNAGALSAMHASEIDILCARLNAGTPRKSRPIRAGRPRKFAIVASVTRAFDDAMAFAYLEISPAQAELLLELIERAVEFRRAADERNQASRYFSVTVGVGNGLPLMRILETSPMKADFDWDGCWVELPPEFTPSAVSNGPLRVECHTVSVNEHGLQFSALAKYGDNRFTTEQIPVSALRAIAEGQGGGAGQPVKPSRTEGENLN